MQSIKIKVWNKSRKGFFGTANVEIRDGVLTCNDDEVILLNTGLKDKNGKEIYEGDILMYRNNMSVKNPGVPFDSYHKVCFGEYDFGEYEDQEDGYGWYIQDIDVENHGSSLTPMSSDLYEVIGNINENPELLK